MFKDVPPHLVRLGAGCLEQADLRAAGRACQRLTEYLTQRFGKPRAQALLLLGLTLARADCPLLHLLQAGPDGHLAPLEVAFQDHPRAEAHAAALALLVHTLHLLATLEGDPAATEAARAVLAR